MRPRSAMKDYQVAAARLSVERRHLALFLAPGDGKTAAALTALVDADALPALVVAPALVVKADVWGEEARLWAHLSGLQVRPVVGPAARRAKLLQDEADVFVVSYENLLWLTNELEGPLSAHFKGLVFDELSKMKHPGTRRFKRLRARTSTIGFCLGLTGSPAGNHLLDLWGEMFMVAGAGPLGKTFGEFKARYFEPVDYQERVWALKGMRMDDAERPTVHTATSRRLEREIHRRVAKYAYARPEGPRDGIPPVREVLRNVPVPPKVVVMLDELRRKLWTKLPSGAELEALSRSTVAGKARQLAGGAVYLSPMSGESAGFWKPPWEAVHDAKLLALDDLLDELQGEPVLVYYWYQHEHDRLIDMLERRGRRFAVLDDAPVVKLWNNRELEVLVAHPQSAGFGLNLQAGGHHVAWYALPWARWMYDQGCGRLARLGQQAPEVTSHLFLCGSVDADVAAVLSTKGDTERRLVEAVRRSR